MSGVDLVTVLPSVPGQKRPYVATSDLSYEGLVRSLIKLELLKDAVAGQHATIPSARRDSGEERFR